MSGTGSKLGNWYEDAALLEGLLRLLAEEIQWLTWENPSDGDGIDFSYAQGETIFGVQCKHHGEGKWKWSSLEKKGASRSVLGYAAQWLDQSKNHLYILQTDATFPQLQTACDEAREQENIEIWQQMHSITVKYLQKKWQVDPIKVYDRCRRIRIKLTGQDTFETHYQTVAGQMCDNGDTLLGVLLDQAKKSLRNCLTASYVRLWLRRKNIELRPKVGEPRIGDFLEKRCSVFLGGIQAVRDIDCLERPQTQQILKSVEDENLVTKVHGAPGSGKSEVLAACVEHWRDEGRAILALRLDRVSDDDLRETRATDLPAFSGPRPAIVVLDQFDTLTWAGGASHPKTEIVRRFLSAIKGKRNQFRLVVACRTLDAAQDTQLKKILDMATQGTKEPRPPYEIQIPAWTPGEVENVLEKAGIAAGDLDPGVLKLTQTPLFLRIVVYLHRKRVKLRGIRSLHDLLDQHWEWTCKEWGSKENDAQLALAEVVKKMQDNGLMQVERSQITNRNGLDAVIATRFLRCSQDEQGNDVLSPSHQTFIDAYIARQWGEVRNIEELLEKIGPKEQQTLQTAGTLRLVVPRLHRTSRGQNLLAEIIEDPALRTLVRVAALRGLASEEADEKDRENLLRWLNNPEIRNLVVDHLLFGNAPWINLALSWLDATWKDEPDYRPILSRLLASVSQTWDGVAKLVAVWTKNDPDLLRTLSDLFWHDPAIDSDALFEQRLRYEERNQRGNVYISFPKLLESHPQRAIRLMAVRLPHVKNDELKETTARVWHSFPSQNDPIFCQAAKALGFMVWQHLRSWWRNLSESEKRLHIVPDHVSLLEEVGEFIAISLTSACQEGTTNWELIRKDLPDLLRRIDVWLLLRIGAHVKSKNTAIAAMRWFMNDLARGHRVLGENPWRWQKEFLKNVSRQVDEPLLAEVEKFLLEYRDDWTKENEQLRFHYLMEGHCDWPTKIGATVYHLLPCLPFLSDTAQNKLGILKEKFKNVPSIFWNGFEFGGGSYSNSAIPNSILPMQDDDWWVARFRQAKEDPKTFRTRKRTSVDDLLGDFTVQSLSNQLQHEAGTNPIRYLSLLQRAQELPIEACWSLLAGLSIQSQDGIQAKTSVISDENLCILVESSPFTDGPANMNLIRIVETRPQAAWAQKTLDRLQAIALDPDDASLPYPGERNDTSSVWNTTSCKAVTALTKVFQNRPTSLDWILDLFQRVLNHPDPIRHLAVAHGASLLRDQHRNAMHEIILSCAQEPRVAANNDFNICKYLYRSVRSPLFSSKQQQTAKTCLLNMASSPLAWVQERYGEIVILLAFDGDITSSTTESAMAGSTSIRTGMAIQLSGRLKSLDWKSWEKSLFLRLANHEKPIREALMAHSDEANLEGLLKDVVFWQSLVKTQAFRENEGLIRACDRHSKLTSIQTLIDDIVTMDLNQSRADKGWGENLHIGLVARLAEEGQRLRDQDTLKHALDLWDRCLENGSGAAIQRLMNTLSDTPQIVNG